MKEAEEFISKHKPHSEYPSYYHYSRIEEMINEARFEAIIECAEAAKSEWVRFGTNMGHQVERQSILNLIDKLK